VALVLAAAGLLAADEVPIGQLNLTNLNSTGYQAVSFYNFTGPDFGCQEGIGLFPVCNGVTITNWTLTVTFTNESPGNASPSYGLFSSPLVETWTSPADDIGPYDPSLNNGYGFTGGLSGTWEIPLNFGGNPDEPPCPASDTSLPSCDYQITQVQFSGTISAVDTPFKLGLSVGNGGNFDASDPSTYTIFTPVSTFSAVWNVSQDDYYSNLSDPLFFGDPSGFNVMVSDQGTPSSVPEPGALGLTGMILAFAVWKARARRN
jgi:hypothetical protein